MDADQAQLKRMRERIGESKAYFEAWASDMETALCEAKDTHQHNVAVDKGEVGGGESGGRVRDCERKVENGRQ
jgi:hypothetical protein